MQNKEPTPKNRTKEDVKAVIEKKEAELKEYVEHLQRLQADFENLQKRVEKEKREVTELANARLVSQILPVLDGFEKAIQAMEEKVDTQVRDGIHMIFTELHKTLTKEGLEIIL